MIKNLFLLALCLPFVLHGSDEFYEDVRHDEVQREFEDVYQNVKPEKQRDFDKIYESLKSSGDVSISDDYTNRDKTGVIISEDAEKVGSLSEAREGKNIDDFSTGKNFYHFSYLYAGGISVSSSLFDSIFKNENSSSGGPIVLSYESKLYGEKLGVSWVANYGIGYFQGKGKFQSDGTESETRFTLWMLPVEFGANAFYHEKGWLKLTAGGGGSVYGIVQSRSDFEDDEDGKNIKQIGIGYFIEGNASFCISKLMPSWRRELFNMYDIGQVYFNLKLRTQYISVLQNDLVISGVTLGAGITFELL